MEWSRARWLRCLLLSLWALGCGDFGESFRYRGGRKLDDGEYYVSTVAWLEYLPVAFASRRDGDGRVLRLVPLTVDGVEACTTRRATRFIAVGQDARYSIAVLDGAVGELDFFDPTCTRMTDGLSNVERVDYLDAKHFLVRDLDGGVLVVNPFEDTTAELGRDVGGIGAQEISYRVEGDPEPRRALWVLEGGALHLRDLTGAPVAEPWPDVRGFATHRGPNYTTRRLVAFEDGAGVGLLEVEGELDLAPDEQIPVEALTRFEDACQPRFVDVTEALILSGCESPSCDGLRDTGSVGTVEVIQPWIAVRQPCEAERLVLHDVYGEQSWEVADGVTRYVVPQTPVEGKPTVLFEAPGDDGSLRTFYLRRGDEPLDMGVRVDFGALVEEPGIYPRMRIVTAEDDPRYGSWDPTDGFEPLLSGVYPIPNMTLVLHDYADERGALSYCTTGGCKQLADGVPRERYRQYSTLARIGEGPKVLSFIHDSEQDDPGGTLTAIRQDTGQRVDVDEGVTSFAPIENGPARGIVYAIADGEREGLWFAPR